jgi:hypothetical protein
MAHTSQKTAHEHKRGVASPRLVKMLGVDARICSNDEPDEIDRGPLTEPVYLTPDFVTAESLSEVRDAGR